MNEACQTRNWIAQDESEACGKPAVEQVNGHWYCAGCLEGAKRHHAPCLRAKKIKLVVSAFGETIGPEELEEDNEPSLEYLTHQCDEVTCMRGPSDSGGLGLYKISDSHQALVCACGLRLVFPSEIKTWKELCAYFTSRVPQDQEKAPWAKK